MSDDDTRTVTVGRAIDEARRLAMAGGSTHALWALADVCESLSARLDTLETVLCGVILRLQNEAGAAIVDAMIAGMPEEEA